MHVFIAILMSHNLRSCVMLNVFVIHFDILDEKN